MQMNKRSASFLETALAQKGDLRVWEAFNKKEKESRKNRKVKEGRKHLRRKDILLHFSGFSALPGGHDKNGGPWHLTLDNWNKVKLFHRYGQLILSPGLREVDTMATSHPTSSKNVFSGELW